jgi:hypothetical protein
MPRYIYDCSGCNKQFEISHGMFHSQRECILCHRVETITKIPSFTLGRASNGPSEPRVGKVVDEFIKDAKKELKEQRKDLKTEYTPK